MQTLQQHAYTILLLGGGVVLLGFWAWPRLKPTFDRALARLRARPGRAPRRADPVAAVARDAEELAVRLAAQIDAKADRLEKLIRIADERLAALEHAAEEGLLDAPRPVGSIRPDAAPRGMPRPPRAVGAGVSIDPDPLSRKVHELADAGKTPREIALSLGEHLGKVQLILALRG